MPEQKIVFNSSLPRAGSTLLQNILAQNPRFYASATSGLIDLLVVARNQATHAEEFKAQNRDAMRKAYLGFCRGGMEGYYMGLTDLPVCVDKSRAWIGSYELLQAFYPQPKILVCVRDLRAILSSMEKLWRKNRHLSDPSEAPGTLTMVSVESRVIHWLNGAPVGIGIARLNNAIQTGILSKLHLVKFEELTTKPTEAMRKIYDYLEEPFFEHDFTNVKQRTIENDSHHLFYGDHKIRQEVKSVPLDYYDVLGREISALIKNQNPLFYSTIYPDK